jgi:hypothetical protein
MSYKTKNFCSPAAIRLSTAILLLASTVNAQDLSSRLSQPASYQPKATTALQQLIEVAQHYRIPMGIEWIQETKEESDPLPEPVKRSTVNDLIAAILQNAPGYVAQQRDGVLQVAKTDFLDKPENFLNLRISEFEIQDAHIFDAKSLLRNLIDLQLHPNREGYGSNGGYGYGVPRDDGFEKRNITFAGNDLTVREILTKIAAANGNALWVVQFSPSQKMSGTSFRAQISLNDGKVVPDFNWHFLPLATNKGNAVEK